jgi:hypothetical protein
MWASTEGDNNRRPGYTDKQKQGEGDGQANANLPVCRFNHWLNVAVVSVITFIATIAAIKLFVHFNIPLVRHCLRRGLKCRGQSNL